MADNSFKVKKSLNIAPIASPTTNEAGDIAFNSGTSSLVLNDGTSTKAIVTDSATQTLTNKTIDAASNTISNIDASMLTLDTETALDLATSNTDSTVNIATGSGTNTVNIGGANTNINLIGNIFSQDVTDLVVSDKLITINDGGAAGSALGSGIEVEEDNVITASVKISTDRNSWELKAPNTAGVASLTPGATNDTVTLNAAAQVLTNKDIDGGTASNARRITLPKDSKTNLDALTRKQGTLVYDTTSNKPYYDDGTVLKVIGSGSGGAVNFIEGGDAEAGTTGWATYADAVGTRPVDGTGGSPNVTWTTSNSSPLTGTNSFLFTKDAANRQGEGVSYAFTIDAASKARVLKIEFDYLVNSGTFVAGSSSADSDVIVYLYDVTNARLIEPSSFKLFSNSTTIADKFSAYFQTAADSTSYRLILHVASTSASAYSLKIDNISVSPSQYVYGTPITDWQDFPSVVAGTLITATTTNPGYGTVAINKAQWRRVGSNMEIRWDFRQSSGGAGGSGAYLFNLPSGFAIDTSKAPANTDITGGGDFSDSGVGHIRINVGTDASSSLGLAVYSSTQLKAQGTASNNAVSSEGVWSPNFNSFAASPLDLSLYASVPIAGWSSSVQMSDSADTRVVVATLRRTTTQSVTANSTDILLTTISDSHAAWDGDSYLIPVAGDYTFTFAGSDNATNSPSIFAYVNGVAQTDRLANLPGGNYHTGTQTIRNLRSGDVVTFRSNISTTLGGNLRAEIVRISGPSAIAATETIACSYWLSANQSVTANTTDILFNSQEYDSHAAYSTSTGRFTAPATGLYEVSLKAFSSTTNNKYGLYKNGTLYRVLNESLSNLLTSGTAKLRLVAGDFITIRANQTSTITGGTLAADGTAILQITRIGL